MPPNNGSVSEMPKIKCETNMTEILKRVIIKQKQQTKYRHQTRQQTLIQSSKNPGRQHLGLIRW